MNVRESQIKYYLDLHRAGYDAFHGLLELGRDALADLIDTYRREPDASIRELLVTVIWQYRDESAIPLLGDALRDRAQPVRNQALDGLVAFASPAALDVLCSARSYELPTRRETDTFRAWLEEAIEQVSGDA